jgi:glycosyltransferase involved in cell wall biosynthesis
MSMDNNETVAVTEFGISVRKSLDTDAAGASAIRFELSSDSDEPMAVQLFQAQPRDRADASATGDGTGGGDWRPIGPRFLEYRTVLDPSETVDVEYAVAGGPEAAQRVYTRPTQVLIRPAGTDSSPAVATLDLGERRERGRTDDRRDSVRPGDEANSHSGGTADIRTDPSPAADDASRPDPVGATSDGSTGAHAAPGTASAEPRPALGLVVTPGYTDAIARTVLRAFVRGYEVYVTHGEASDPEALEMAESLGATVVSSAGSPRETLRDSLAMVGHVQGHAGIVFQTAPYETIDYERSVAALAERDTDVVDAVLETGSRGEMVTIAGIPAYNEQETIAEVVEKTLAHVDEVLVVDDGSTDMTATRAERAGATVVRHPRNRGYGGALKTLFEQAARRNVSCLAVVDADGQHDPEDIESLVAAQRESDADIVIGSRFVPGAWTNMPLYRRVGVTVVNVLLNLSLGALRSESYISDTQSGFRVYSSRAIQSLAEDSKIGEGMNASIDIIFHAQSRGYTFEEVPTSVDYTVINASSQHPLTHGLELVKNIFVNMEQRRPIAMLGVPGFVSLLVGLGFGYWSLHNYLLTDTFPLGIGLVAVLFTLVGIFAYFTAIVLHAVDRSYRRQS